MKTYFFSYHFADKGGTGFGDMSLEGDGVYSMADLKEAKQHIVDALVSKGYTDPTVVIMSWREFDERPVNSD